MKRAEPRAWIRKYFKAASEEYVSYLDVRRGTNEIRFSSSPSQQPNQDELEIVIKIPKFKVKKKNSKAG